MRCSRGSELQQAKGSAVALVAVVVVRSKGELLQQPGGTRSRLAGERVNLTFRCYRG